MAKKKLTIPEFKTWLEGLMTLKDEDWSPSPDEWKIICDKLENLKEVKEPDSFDDSRIIAMLESISKRLSVLSRLEGADFDYLANLLRAALSSSGSIASGPAVNTPPPPPVDTVLAPNGKKLEDLSLSELRAMTKDAENSTVKPPIVGKDDDIEDFI